MNQKTPMTTSNRFDQPARVLACWSPRGAQSATRGRARCLHVVLSVGKQGTARCPRVTQRRTHSSHRLMVARLVARLSCTSSRLLEPRGTQGATRGRARCLRVVLRVGKQANASCPRETQRRTHSSHRLIGRPDPQPEAAQLPAARGRPVACSQRPPSRLQTEAAPKNRRSHHHHRRRCCSSSSSW